MTKEAKELILTTAIFLISIQCMAQKKVKDTGLYNLSATRIIGSSHYTISEFTKPTTYTMYFSNSDSSFTIKIDYKDMGKVAKLLSELLTKAGIKNEYFEEKRKF